MDTTVWVDLLYQVDSLQTQWLERELRIQSFALTDLILCEILQGLRDEGSFAKVRLQMSQFRIFDTGGEDIAVASASHYRGLHARGITVRKTIDCVIATYCIRHGHILLHNDRDFDPFERHLGLRVIHPQAQ